MDDPAAFLVAALVWGLIWGALCAIGAHARGRDELGWFVSGLLFSILALAALLVLPSLARKPDVAAPVVPDSPGAHPESRHPNASLIAALPEPRDERRECPHCAELIRKNARICRFCNRDASTALA